MVWAESPISGTSTNPARSLGPAIVSGEWQGWWIYWVGPLIGTLVAVIVLSFFTTSTAIAIGCSTRRPDVSDPWWVALSPIKTGEDLA
jgi:hypothetical protein